MNVQAEVSLYPLRTACVGEAVNEFVSHLRRAGLNVHTGPMSSHVTGEHAKLFAALAESLNAVARRRQVVLTIKVSNACPPLNEQQHGEQNA